MVRSTVQDVESLLDMVEAPLSFWHPLIGRSVIPMFTCFIFNMKVESVWLENTITRDVWLKFFRVQLHLPIIEIVD